MVDTGTTGKYLRHYGVLTATDPAANSLTLEQPYLGLSGDVDEAGQLFLVLDYQPTPPPTPFSTQTVGHTKADPQTTQAKPTNHRRRRRHPAPPRPVPAVPDGRSRPGPDHLQHPHHLRGRHHRPHLLHRPRRGRGGDHHRGRRRRRARDRGQ